MKDRIEYRLTGFTDLDGFRVFAFEGTGANRIRLEYNVKADTALARKYGIRIQELPLLCREVLERRIEGDGQTMTYPETEMSQHAIDLAAAQIKRKAPRPRQAAATAESAAAAQ